MSRQHVPCGMPALAFNNASSMQHSIAHLFILHIVLFLTAVIEVMNVKIQHLQQNQQSSQVVGPTKA